MEIWKLLLDTCFFNNLPWMSHPNFLKKLSHNTEQDPAKENNFIFSLLEGRLEEEVLGGGILNSSKDETNSNKLNNSTLSASSLKNQINLQETL